MLPKGHKGMLQKFGGLCYNGFVLCLIAETGCEEQNEEASCKNLQ